MKSERDNFRWRRRGFTLMEMVLALAMVAVIGGSLYASMYGAMKARTAAETAVEPSRTAELAMEFMRFDLQNATPPGGDLSGNFEGTQAQDDRGHEGDDIQFFTTSDARDHQDANGELKFVELTVETTPDGDHALVRKVTRNLIPPEDAAAPAPDEEIICRGVWSFSVQYFNGTVWEPTWDSTTLDDQLPTAAEVTLQLQRPSGTGSGTKTLTYQRIFTMSCSSAAEDSNLNTDDSGQ